MSPTAVKHFKYVPRGKIRLHQKPVTVEIKACRPWLERELDFVQPKGGRRDGGYRRAVAVR